MRGYCLLLLLVVLLLVPESDSLWRRRRRRRRRFWRRVGRFFRRVGRGIARATRWVKENGGLIKTGVDLIGKRELEAIDANKDGIIDQSEAEMLTNEKRFAGDLMSMADEDGDSVVSVDEFARSLREVSMLDDDEFDQLDLADELAEEEV